VLPPAGHGFRCRAGGEGAFEFIGEDQDVHGGLFIPTERAPRNAKGPCGQPLFKHGARNSFRELMLFAETRGMTSAPRPRAAPLRTHPKAALQISTVMAT
jgi:hypothetical protein